MPKADTQEWRARRPAGFARAERLVFRRLYRGRIESWIVAVADRGVLEEESSSDGSRRFRLHPRSSLRAAKRKRAELCAERGEAAWLQISGGVRFERLELAAEAGRGTRTEYKRRSKPAKPESLSAAACVGDARAARRFLEAGQDPNAVEGYALPPLALAAKFGNRGVAALLLDLGADPAPNSAGPWAQPIDSAATRGDARLVTLLLDAQLPAELLGRAVFLAACKGHLRIVRTLLGAGGDPNYCPDPDTAFPPLRWVLAYDDEAMARLLDRHGAVAHIEVTPAEREREKLFDQLCDAAVEGRTSQVKRLLKAGAPPNPRLIGHENPLCEAARAGHRATVRLLLQAGADPRRFSDIPAIHWAARRGDLAMLKLLLGAGASIDETDSDGDTPLSIAIEKRRGRVADYLIAHGATPVSMGTEEVPSTANPPMGRRPATARTGGALRGYGSKSRGRRR